MTKTTIKTGVQGFQGSYHEQALVSLQGDNHGVVYIDTHDNVFNALKEGTIDAAVVAIKNNRYGFVPQSLNRILRGEFAITDEVYVRIDHQLLGLPGAKLVDITEVHSHPAALGQCTKLLTKLSKQGVTAIEENDTAESAQMVAQLQDPTKAAIASKKAGELHGLVALVEHAQDDQNNITRFVRVENMNGQNTSVHANKTTALLKTGNQAGGLVAALLPFAEGGVNITDLHSYPVPNSAFTMEFFIEFDGSILDRNIQGIFAKIQKQGGQIMPLGSYEAHPVPVKL